MDEKYLSKTVIVEPTKKIKLILFSLLIILDTVIRIPSIPHEAGSDSFFIHTLANSITGFGHANWWLHWLSIFGYYPYSYSSAVPFSLSGISQLTGIEMEYSILLYCVILGLFSIFSSYLLAGLLYEDFLFKYLMAFFYSISPSIMFFTTWEISPRGPFNVFLPLFFYLVLKQFNYSKRTILFLIMTIFLFSVHHLSIALMAFTLLFIIIKLFSKIKYNENIYFYLKNKSSYLKYSYILLFLISFTQPFFNPSSTGITGSRYGWIITSITIIVRFIGPMSFFCISGLIYLIFKEDKQINLWYILCIFVLLVPFMYNLTYGIHLAQLFIIIILTVGFRNVFNLKVINSSKLVRIFIITIILSSVIFSSFYNHFRTGDRKDARYMDESTYKSGEWVNHHIDKEKRVLYISDGFRMIRSLALQENGSSIFTGGTEGLTYGFIDKSLIKNLEPVPITDSYFYFEGAYRLNERIDPFANYDWLLMSRGIGTIKGTYNLSYTAQSTSSPAPIGFNEDNEERIYSDGKLEIYDLRNILPYHEFT